MDELLQVQLASVHSHEHLPAPTFNVGKRVYVRLGMEIAHVMRAVHGLSGVAHARLHVLHMFVRLRPICGTAVT